MDDEDTKGKCRMPMDADDENDSADGGRMIILRKISTHKHHTNKIQIKSIRSFSPLYLVFHEGNKVPGING